MRLDQVLLLYIFLQGAMVVFAAVMHLLYIRFCLSRSLLFSVVSSCWCFMTSISFFPSSTLCLAFCAAVEYDTGAVGLDDLVFRRLSFPPDEFATGEDKATDACDVMNIGDMIFRRTNLPLDEFSAGRNGIYIWLNSGTGLSVCAIPVTGSLRFGHPRGLLSLHCLESVPQTQNFHCQTTVFQIRPDACYSCHI